MSIFMLDTDSVSSVAGSLDSLASQVENIASSVSGYDTSCEDGFDFAGAKAVIAENIKACAIKISNTSAVINNVVSSHSKLQSSLVYNGSQEEQSSSSSESSGSSYSSSGYSSSGYSGNSSGYYSTGATATTGGYVSSLSNNNTSTGESGTTTTTTTETVPEENENKENNENKEENNNNTTYTQYDSSYKEEEDKVTPKYDDVVKTVAASSGVVGCALLDVQALSDEGQKFVGTAPITYPDDGYAMVGDMYVISCDSSLGKVGDYVTITLKDGTEIKCLIGDNSLEEGQIKFFVNDSWVEDAPNNITNNLGENIDKVVNYGSGQASGYISMLNLPQVGEHTSDIEKLDEKWTVISSKISLEDYEKIMDEKELSQDVDPKYNGSCLGISYLHASNLYKGESGDSVSDALDYKHADEFNSFYSEDKDEALKLIYAEVLKGKPVIMQVNGNKEGTTSHFVTVVGFRSSVTDPSKLTEKDLLVIDPFDGKVARMDQDGSRFMTNGKNTGMSYDGYYLRTVKD